MACQDFVSWAARAWWWTVCMSRGCTVSWAAPGAGGGALLAHGAGSAGGFREADHDGVSAALAHRVPRGAGVPLGAGGLLAVEVDAEAGAVESGARPWPTETGQPAGV